MDLSSRAIETVAGHNVIDLGLWLAAVIAFLVVCELIREAVVWVRGFSGEPNPPRCRRGGKVVQVATGQADDVGGVR